VSLHLRYVASALQASTLFPLIRYSPDAVPKKRGPKHHVLLEALLSRVDGLEQRLKDQKSPESGVAAGDESEGSWHEASGSAPDESRGEQPKTLALDNLPKGQASNELPEIYSPSLTRSVSPQVMTYMLIYERVCSGADTSNITADRHLSFRVMLC
jgi:hypothetical protein